MKVGINRFTELMSVLLKISSRPRPKAEIQHGHGIFFISYAWANYLPVWSLFGEMNATFASCIAL